MIKSFICGVLLSMVCWITLLILFPILSGLGILIAGGLSCLFVFLFEIHRLKQREQND